MFVRCTSPFPFWYISLSLTSRFKYFCRRNDSAFIVMISSKIAIGVELSDSKWYRFDETTSWRFLHISDIHHNDGDPPRIPKISWRGNSLCNKMKQLFFEMCAIVFSLDVVLVVSCGVNHFKCLLSGNPETESKYFLNLVIWSSYKKMFFQKNS